eukprot:TRINITY_DN2654_c0_g1_i1.p1 TRINITY_DN2654_c0_g1~~TRINITY_DN2654_c0_g1_i1.p1  ORF type:complete len:644 (+),score=223.98 TRINITY_DN2654_c0_g1_i1:1407-3338(+)
MLEHRKLLRQLRQDLEKVRLLCELIRKREQRKRELILIDEKRVSIQLTPLPVFLGHVMDSLELADTQEFFVEPVSVEDVPDYLDHIKHPMDFSTMRSKLNTYKSLDCLRKDFVLVCENCLSYNEKDTIFYKAGVKLREAGDNIIKEARKIFSSIGFDSLGLLPSKKKEAEDALLKEIDAFLSDKNPLKKGGDQTKYLKKLNELQTKASSISQLGAKNRRLRSLKQEIAAAKRRKSTDRLPSKIKAEELSRKFDFEEEDHEPIVHSARKLRTSSREGANNSATTEVTPAPTASKKRGRKRLSRIEDEDEESVENNAPKKTKTSESPFTKAPTAKSSPLGGVNRRNAVLFTRKKISASQKEEDSVRTTSGKRKAEDFRKKVSPKAIEEEMDVDEPHINNNNNINHSSPSSSPPLRKRARRSKGGEGTSPKNTPTLPKPSPKASATSADKKNELSLSSFRHYRRGASEVVETDEDSGSGSEGVLGSSDSESDTDSDDSDDSDCASSRGGSARVPLEPLDLVWAKTRGYPWYPALIINPKMPRTGYLHNGVPIPVPPKDVLDMASAHSSPHYLILFFDSKRTWQWLTRDKLEPLGIDSKVDKSKLIQAKKPGEKKAVKKAYEDAIVHRCKVTGENLNFSEESPDEKS